MSERFMARLAVFVVLRNEKGEILLQQRFGTGYLDGYWDLPSGHVEQGEAVRDTAARELYEEIGVRVRPEDLTLTHIEQFFMAHNYVNFTFTARQWAGEPKVCEPEKCSAVGWFAPNALPEKCVNAVRSNEASDFSKELTYGITDQASYPGLMREALEAS